MSKASSIWWLQRVSALALVPLACWFVYFVLKIIEYKDLEIISSMFISPFVVILLILFISTGIYHGNIGIKEIIEDYVHCQISKQTLIILTNFVSIISIIVGVCSCIVLHISVFGAN